MNNNCNDSRNTPFNSFSNSPHDSLQQLRTNNSIKALAINDSGFVFCPTTGQSFSLNGSGLTILRLLQKELASAEIVSALVATYQVTPQQLEQDLTGFAAELQRLLV